MYVQSDRRTKPIRVGKAAKGLETRYRGGTAYAIDAAMHQSGNFFFVAPISNSACSSVEAELIWRGRKKLPHNNIGKKNPPIRRIALQHMGESPDFSDFE